MQPADDTEIFRQLREGRTLFGPGWRWVDSFEEVDDDLEDDEEEEYVVMDLGTAMDARTLQTEATYQLIGMDTPMPFLKIGEHVFQGTVSPLIGDEVILDVVRQEDDPQRPRHRPAYKTRNRVELRGVNLTARSEATAAAVRTSPPKPGKADTPVRSFFPARGPRRGRKEGEADDDDDMDVDEDGDMGEDEELRTAFRASQFTGVAAASATGTEPARPSGLRHSVAASYADGEDEDEVAALALQTPTPVGSFGTPGPTSRAMSAAAAPTPTPGLHAHPSAQLLTPAPGTPVTPDSRKRTYGRPRGSTSRASLPVSTMTDLADIAHAGGLGDVRLEIAETATPELLAAVSAIRGKPSGPGTKLSRAQEERLVRGLPPSGPGSRGGRGGRGRGTPTGRPRGRPRGRGGIVNPAGVGLADGFLGIVGDEEWDDEDGEGVDVGAGAGPSAAGPSSIPVTPWPASASVPPAAAASATAPSAAVPEPRADSDEELREIGDE